LWLVTSKSVYNSVDGDVIVSTLVTAAMLEVHYAAAV